MSWIQYVEPIGNDFLDNVKENMMRDINTWVLMDKKYFESAKEKANELLGNRFVTIIVNKSHNDAVAIPFLITAKGRYNVDLLYNDYEYRESYGIDKVTLITYVPYEIVKEMINKARIYLEYYKYHVYTFDMAKKPQRDYVIKLLMYDTLRVLTWDKYSDLYAQRLVPYRDVWDTYNRYAYETCPGIDAIDCLIRNLLPMKQVLRDWLIKIAEKKLRWLKRKVELHNVLTRVVSRYITRFLINHTYSYANDMRRAREYIEHYKSYVEFDHVNKYVRVVEPYSILPTVLLSGFEENEKFVRIKLDLVYYDYVKFGTYGSWIIGIDKLTNQSFSISLPYICASAPFRVCVEYIYGIRNDDLHKRFSDVEISEV